MSPTRREVLTQLAAVTVLPLGRWVGPTRTRSTAPSPTIRPAESAGRGTAVEVTSRALERCRSEGMKWRAIDALSPSALDEARAADARLRAGTMKGRSTAFPSSPRRSTTCGVCRLPAPAPIGRACSRSCSNATALEVSRLRAAGAIVLGKTAADDFAYHGNGTSSHTGQVLNPHDPTGTRRREDPAPARPSRSRPEWPSPHSAPTTAAPTASRRSSPAWSG
jgi:aspartyl-tRNA(Asn)/glutamyl-tRNA(Gln) amidotransferase subunit A